MALRPGLPKPMWNMRLIMKNRKAPPMQMMIDGRYPLRVKPLRSDR